MRLKHYLLLLFLLPIFSFSQDAFSSLDKSTMTTSVLYNKSVKVVDLLEENPNKINATYFRQAYSQLQQSDDNHNFPLNYSDFKNIKEEGFRNNFIPIGIINSQFETISEQAIENDLVRVDTNNKILNNSTNHDVFELHHKIISSPLTVKAKGLSQNFRFASEYYFSNSNEQISTIKVNFNDGRGFISISENQEVSVLYNEPGEKRIDFEVKLTSGEIFSNSSYLTVQRSNSELNAIAPSDEGPITTFHSTLSYQGFDDTIAHLGTGEYKIYYDNVDGVLDKPIFFIDGFDPGDGRTIDLMYSSLDFGNPVENLADTIRDEGFDLIVLNFPNYTSQSDGTTTIDGGADYIQRNAYLLVELINIINSMKVGNEENVVIGPSMGGLISRYALRYMEQNAMNHETRLYISFDSPHLGANVPIGLQYLFNTLANGPAPNAAAQDAINGLLDSPAAKQMLTDHYSAHLQSGSAYEQDSNLLTPMGAPNFRDNFQSEIETMGFPINTRNVSIINGSEDLTLTGSLGGEVINTTIDIDANTRADVIFRFTPDAGVTNTVTDLGVEVQIIPFVWIPLFSFTADAMSPAMKPGVDSAPGGLFDMTSFDDGSDPLITDFVNNLNITEFDFIPSVSAMAMDADSNGVNWHHDIDIGAGSPPTTSNAQATIDSTPFINWYMPTANEDHVLLTQGNVTFALTEILVETLSSSSDDFIISILNNPINNNTLEIKTNKPLNGSNLKVIDILGKEVFKSEITSTSNRISIPLNLSKGLYIVNITNKKLNFTTKIIAN